MRRPETVTTKLVVEPDVTTAGAPLNATILLAGVALKFVPVIVTKVPAAPVVGVNDVIVGGSGPQGDCEVACTCCRHRIHCNGDLAKLLLLMEQLSLSM